MAKVRGLCAGLTGVKACQELSAVNVALVYVTIQKKLFRGISFSQLVCPVQAGMYIIWRYRQV